jgi:tRNA nucleotidyltransferase (CCA-adding enzyme)
MRIYTVGGAIRDELLGLAVKDRDHVVVGATPEAMLAEGYRPVGKDFPVFLHPRTQEEYALARTERKSGRGYHGFVIHADPAVTLEEDLARRDLTINAMARGDDGLLVDPFGGRCDIESRTLRHVGPAFVEDPVRILRVARFAARLTDFTVAPETADLMCRVVDDGEVDHLVAERVWQEISRGLMEACPSRMFEVLRGSGALGRLLPEVDALFGVPQRADYHPEGDVGTHTMMVLDAAARLGFELPVRWAALLHDLGKARTPADILPRHHGHEQRGVALVRQLCERLRVPADCRDLALLATAQHGILHTVKVLRPATRVELLEKTDAFRRPARFEQLLQVCIADFNGRGGEKSEYEAPPLWREALAAAAAVDAGAIAASCSAQLSSGAHIAERIRAARVQAVRLALPQRASNLARPDDVGG